MVFYLIDGTRVASDKIHSTNCWPCFEKYRQVFAVREKVRIALTDSSGLSKTNLTLDKNRDDPCWTTWKDSSELIELSSINKVSLV